MTEFWEKTIQIFNNYIDYPQLTEKYLKRPPFKYIFQIFLTLNTKTNFSEDQFKEEELNPDFYETPEKKMAFLKQIIKIVYDLNPKPCPIKPQSIIKGTECDKTNEFLQDMYIAAVSFEAKKKQTGSNEKNAKKTIQSKEPVSTPNVTQLNQEISKAQPQEKVTQLSVIKKPILTKMEPTNESNPKGINQKENKIDKKQPETQSKIVQQLVENALKEEKIAPSTRVNSGSQNDKGIKMGKLNAGVCQPGHVYNNETNESESKEINSEEIKLILQKLTQNTNPMGKLVEFVDDDLDAMNKECKKWLKTYKETEEKLQKIEEDQNDDMQNYNYTLNEINEQVFDYENRILSIRSRIQKNNSKIDSMLSKVIG